MDTAEPAPAAADTVDAPGRRRFPLRYESIVMSVAVLLMVVPAVALFPGVGNLTEGLNRGITQVDLIAFVVLAVLGGAIKGISGFGYALLVTPLAALVIDPTVAVAVLAVPPLMLNLFQVGETGVGLSWIKQNWALILTGLIGGGAGVYLLKAEPSTPVIPLLIAIVLLIYVLHQTTKRFAVLPKAGNRPILSAVGLIEGFLLGASNLGPLMPAYLHTFERNAKRYIGGMSMFFTLVFAERIIQMSLNGVLTGYRLWLGAAIGVITLVGLLIGTGIRRLFNVNKDRFNMVVVALLFVIAVNMLWHTIPKFF